MGNRRVSQHLAEYDLFLVKPFIILICRVNHRIMFRLICLDHGLPGQRSSPCASNRLCQQLECALSRPVICRIQGQIRRQNPHQSYFRKIMPLYNHLGADQYICFPIGKCGQNFLVAVFRSGGVRIHAQRSHLGKQNLKLFLNLLCARLETADVF